MVEQACSWDYFRQGSMAGRKCAGGGQWVGAGEGGIAKLQICKKCMGYGLVEILDTLKYHFSCFRGNFSYFSLYVTENNSYFLEK